MFQLVTCSLVCTKIVFVFRTSQLRILSGANCNRDESHAMSSSSRAVTSHNRSNYNYGNNNNERSSNRKSMNWFNDTFETIGFSTIGDPYLAIGIIFINSNGLFIANISTFMTNHEFYFFMLHNSVFIDIYVYCTEIACGYETSKTIFD